MSSYYKGKRSRNIFDPLSHEPFRVSRSKIELFSSCPRCFYIDVRLGVGQPPGFPFNLNSAVDTLLKKEFDIHRSMSTAHPLMEAYGLDAVPFSHEKMDEWRDPFKGVTFLHEPTNFYVTGGVDDVWQNPEKELIIVDYKSTSKESEVTIDAEWQQSYKRQMEIYQWLFRNNGFSVSDTGYFVYCNGRRDVAAFDGKLEFDIKLIPYTGSDLWIESALASMKQLLMADVVPEPGDCCDFCTYRRDAREVLTKLVTRNS
ncbi:PD-(D/E)XK nuclease family protein [Candidatus Uhrbacteria bacterium]|nr:PD-(D/E)XK nuclease family protein [Candidatus Uhrbacteria bacterium]